MASPLNDFPEAIIFLDTENQIIGINLAGEHLLKMKHTDLIGRSVDTVFPRQSSSAYRDEILRDGRKEVSLSRGDGQVFYAELTVSTVSGLEGSHVGRVVLIRDSAHSQQSEMRLKQEQSLKTQNLMLRAIQETAFDLHSSLDLNIVLHNIVERACQLLGTKHGYLDMLRETGVLEPVVGIGALAESLRFGVVMGEGVSGTVWKTGNPVVISDYDTWPDRISDFSRGLIRTIIGMPLILKGEVVGVIGVAKDFKDDTIFSEDDVSMLRRFADLAVVALQNARLFERAQAELKFRRKTEIELRNANQLLQLQIERVELLQVQLKELAVRDSLTNLFNRRYLHEMLEVEFARSKRSQTSLAILMMDSDHLKVINDKYGHKAGDEFLMHIANVIRENIRAGDIACRYGGDEFVVVLSNVTENIAFDRAERLRGSVFSNHIIHKNEKISASVSIGIAMFPAHGSSGDILLQKADLALYAAKRMGKNKVLTYAEDLD
jgi:diguanylate cyclase (GGDEF)-like protein/PAS domain S-box-containing protein